MKLGALFGGETIEVTCMVDIEQTRASFHAYAVPEDVDIRPGDRVTVHDVPTDIGFGEHVACLRKATVVRAGLLERAWTRFTGMFEITELYEVGFAPREGR